MGRAKLFVAPLVAALSLGTTQAIIGQHSKPTEPNAAEFKVDAGRTVDATNHLAREKDAGCENRKDRRGSDLCAQWKAADAARDAADYTFLAVFLSFIGTLLVAATFWEQRKVARAELRAYVSVRIAKMPEITLGNAPIVVTIETENTGSTPANEYQTEVAWEVSAGEPTKEYHTATLAKYVGLFEGSRTFGPKQVKIVPYPANIGDEFRAKILAGEMSFYFMGRLHYDDIFGKKHVTEFFYRYTTALPNRLGQCPVCNHIG